MVNGCSLTPQTESVCSAKWNVSLQITTTVCGDVWSAIRGTLSVTETNQQQGPDARWLRVLASESGDCESADRCPTSPEGFSETPQDPRPRPGLLTARSIRQILWIADDALALRLFVRLISSSGGHTPRGQAAVMESGLLLCPSLSSLKWKSSSTNVTVL